MAVLRLAQLLFGSGACALIYQTVWLRELRLVFGASTSASAAVLAIFMAGLGAGGVLIGRRAEAKERPLLLYANLELLIAGTSAATPLLIWLARHIYIALGGSMTLGAALSTLIRLLLSTMVLLVPTFLMGGTLPAVARAVETGRDARRRSLAILYGTNTLGAVTGALLSTFFMLEVFGNQRTLWIACMVNAIVGMAARVMSRRMPPVPVAADADAGDEAAEGGALPSRWFVLPAAAVSGFVFLLMELVWYRMLSPLLGGSSFTFGLILAVALAGIGAGGVVYALFGERRPATLFGFAATCLLEALFIALPYGLGDRLAVLTVLMRALGAMGFSGHVLSWTLITALVVFPAALFSGVQFPMLIGLLGRGGKRVAEQVGLCYAWNTGGAIIGSLAGGFGLLPLLSAPGLWRLSGLMLCALGATALVLSMKGTRRPAQAALALAALATVLLCLAPGPTAAWRHSGIGVGWSDPVFRGEVTQNTIRGWQNDRRRSLVWETDGVESSVAAAGENGLSFVVNGKNDGNAKMDAGTQVLSGLIGSALHKSPRRVLVVGLGTGSTAGWMAAVKETERVDAVEIEPAILRFAKDSSSVNHDALKNPKLRTFIGDAREVLLTTPERYDIIVSEPSNPYRAGIASLFTADFYRSVTSRLSEDGLFLQWMQAYDVDSQTVRTAYATLSSVFPVVETWQTEMGDLLLVAAMRPIVYDVPALRARLMEEPFRTALDKIWRTEGVEGLLAHFIASASLAKAVAKLEGEYINTDDHNLMEFEFARSIGRHELFNVYDLWGAAMRRREDRPAVSGGAVDWARVDDERISMFAATGQHAPFLGSYTKEQLARSTAQIHYHAGRLEQALASFRAQSQPPRNRFELALVAEALAQAGDDEALSHIERLRASQPVEADAILARLHLGKGRPDEAAAALARAFIRHREDPWPLPELMERALKLAEDIAAKRPRAAKLLFDAIRAPFAVSILNDARMSSLVSLAFTPGLIHLCAEALAQMEPHVPWNRPLLTRRLSCYARQKDERERRARSDLDAFLEAAPRSFHHDLSLSPE